eukprot:TRINITY_DN230_c1_g1_i2.p1 TRINITY_DN230_c1_g1~~TRINITY_DN230_c1_g1_i2.p1  ORF type:complete len:102 (-),score=12.43 TRINITY_DN230_c1_g1_i2:36-341(-)
MDKQGAKDEKKGIFSIFSKRQSTKKDSSSPTFSQTGYSVSTPFSLSHPVHVDFNSATGFTGLPKAWESLLKSNARPTATLFYTCNYNFPQCVQTLIIQTAQ